MLKRLFKILRTRDDNGNTLGKKNFGLSQKMLARVRQQFEKFDETGASAAYGAHVRPGVVRGLLIVKSLARDVNSLMNQHFFTPGPTV
jgi:hypothetical protein